jgi:plastocyanin
MRTRMLTLAALVAAFVLAAAGCGGDDDSDNGGGGSAKQSSGTAGNDSSGGAAAGGGGASTIKLSAPASGALKFDQSSVSTKPGKVTIDFDNPSQVPHAVEVEGNGVEEETKKVTNGKASVTVNLKKGKYEFYCPVDGHKQAGMEGTLTVG